MVRKSVLKLSRADRRSEHGLTFLRVLLELPSIPWPVLWLEGAVFAAVVLGFKAVNENQLREGLRGAGGAVALQELLLSVKSREV